VSPGKEQAEEARGQAAGPAAFSQGWGTGEAEAVDRASGRVVMRRRLNQGG
jgi:hypothetical protein